MAVLLQSGSVTEDDEAVPGACEGLHSSIRPFVHSSIHPFVRSFVRSFVSLTVHKSSAMFVCLFVS